MCKLTTNEEQSVSAVHSDMTYEFIVSRMSNRRLNSLKIFLHLLLASFLSSTILASGEDGLGNFTRPHRLSSPASDITGRLCMTVEHFKSGLDVAEFYECSPLSEQEVKEYKLADKYLGIWTKRDCPENFEFDETKQRCIENRKLRRQQVACGVNPASQGCQSPCLASNQSPDVGAPCNWLTAKLMPDPLSTSYFLQCTIQNPGETCGEWVRMPCTPGTEFDVRTQVCVPSNFLRENRCGPNALPICPCAQEATGAACPGQASCQNDVCCEGLTMDVSLTLPQQSPGVVCMGSNLPPISSCYPSCPPSYQCQENIGCCPSSAVIVPQHISMSLCPDYTPAIGTCSSVGSCPNGYVCNNNLGGCCRQQASDSTYTAVILCPSGTPALGPCGRMNQCPDGQGCYQGACCPMVCPQGLSPNGFCNSNSCSSGSCQNGCCCSETPNLPICSNGKTAITVCIRDEECGGAGMECSNGGCCSVSYCPSGIQSIGRCSNGGNCGTSGVVCLEGLCCPLPPCNNGGLAIGVCSVNSNCGNGFECQNFGCCPLPKCPTGAVAIKRCGKGGCCCPNGASCVNDLCCELPKCATGAVAIGFCNRGNSCGSGAQCVSGACCPLPRCPSGAMGSQFCQIGSACPAGQICANGVCCNLPTCSYTGQIAMSVCGMGNACPMGYICEGRGCCPEPMPLCPNGGRASQKCHRGVDCPPGYGCTSMGGCCLLSLEAVCPRNQNAICQCSSSNSCPAYASCNMGTCCTSSVAAYNLNPGSRCQYATQCNGQGQSYSSCLQNTCVCVKGSYSNGVSCNSPNTIVLNRARSGCDQYGSPCKYVFSTARRKPIFAPVNNETETPLWYSVSSERNCVLNDSSVDFDPDSTCLPSEKCIDGKCKLKLWPGEYGCSNDFECSARCSNTYCEAKSDKNVPQCQCKSGLLLYSRCFEKCPTGFHESGAYCMHDDEDAFWENAEAQENLQKLLNEGEC